MNWPLILLLALATIQLSAGEHKPTIRALIACDMTSKDIRAGSKADKNRMKKSLSNIARLLGLQSKITVLPSRSFTPHSATQWLKKIPPNSNDIIIFYFSGHGGRIKKFKAPWPFLVFPGRSSSETPRLLIGDNVCSFIAQKQPRFALIMFDSCNNFFREKGVAAPKNIHACIQKNKQLSGLKKLFLQTRGILVASAASPGELAVTSVRGSLTGGIFTTGFILSLKQLSQKPNPTWKEVFLGTSEFCGHYFLGKQHPFFATL